MKKSTAELKKELTKPRIIRKVKGHLPTGSALLNLLISKKATGGFPLGCYSFIVGESQSGKTLISLTSLAAAANSKRFDDYRLIFDNAENGALFDQAKFFGSKLVGRLEPPKLDKDGEPLYSSSIEEFYFNLDDAIQDGRPFIYVLDSMDVLSSEGEEKKFQSNKKAFRKMTSGDDDAEMKGSMGDGKAKANSSNLRRPVNKLWKSQSVLIILSQVKDNIKKGFFSFGQPDKTRSGGHSLRYYAHVEVWFSLVKQITKEVGGKKRRIGTLVKAKAEKGREYISPILNVELPIYDTGIDDTGSCVDFLINEGHWKGKGQIDAEEFGITAYKEKLIQQIEETNQEKKLKEIVGQVWSNIEEQCAVPRKMRFQ